jgi:hypothetical protein
MCEEARGFREAVLPSLPRSISRATGLLMARQAIMRAWALWFTELEAALAPITRIDPVSQPLTGSAHSVRSASATRMRCADIAAGVATERTSTSAPTITSKAPRIDVIGSEMTAS